MYFTISPKARRKKRELKGRLHMKGERERRWNAKKQPTKNPEAQFWIQCIRGNERKYRIKHIFRKKSPLLWWSKAEEVKWQWKVYLIIVRIQELSPCLHIYSFSFVDSPPTSKAIRKAEKYCSLFSSYRPANEQGKQASGKIYVLSFNSNPVVMWKKTIVSAPNTSQNWSFLTAMEVSSKSAVASWFHYMREEELHITLEARDAAGGEELSILWSGKVLEKKGRDR